MNILQELLCIWSDWKSLNGLSFLEAGLLIFRGKKANFLGIFRGKFVEKLANFAGFSGEESQNSRKNRLISGIFAGKSQNSQKNRLISRDFHGKKSDGLSFLEAGLLIFRGKKANFLGIFRGKFSEKSADFMGNFGGKPRHETISKKQPISLDFWGKFRSNRSILRRYDQRCLTFF